MTTTRPGDNSQHSHAANNVSKPETRNSKLETRRSGGFLKRFRSFERLSVIAACVVAATLIASLVVWRVQAHKSETQSVNTTTTAPGPTLIPIKWQLRSPSAFDQLLSQNPLAPTVVSFTPGNLVIYRVDGGGAALTANATAVFLDEYSSTGTLVQSIAMPTSVSGSNKRFTANGSSTAEGLMTRSTDGRYLVAMGYDAPIPTATPSNVAATTINRVLARVDTTGAVDTTTALTDSYGGTSSTAGNPRGAISTNGTDLWLSGNASSAGAAGSRYTTIGGTTAVQLSGSPTNIRATNIFNGQLYISSASGAFLGVSSVGSGLPTTGSQTTTALPGFPTTGTHSSYQFAFANSSTLYVADDGTFANAGGIQKWTLSGGTWSLSYTLLNTGAATTAVRGLVVDSSGANPVIYATTTATSANTLIKVIDTGSGSTATTLATAPANTAFRGVAFAPQAALSVSSTSPADAATNVATSSSISVTFNTPVDTSTITTQSVAGACSGSLQVSSDNFTTCIGLGSPAASGGNTIFTATPSAALAGGTTYKIRVTTAAKTATGSPLSAAFTQATGFTTAAPVLLKYRSRTTGQWNDFNTWQVDPGSGFVNATSGQTPTSADDTIQIQNTHTVTVTAAVTVDQVTVDSGGALAVSDVLTNSGALALNGKFQVNQGGSVTGTALTYGGLSVLRYEGTSAQTSTNIEFPASNGPAGLAVNNAGGVTLHAPRSITGTLSLLGGALDNTTNNITVGATILRDTGTLSAAPTFGSTVAVIYVNATAVTSGNEIPTSTSVLTFLTINKSGGVTLGGNATVNTSLSLQSGNITTGANTLALAAGSTFNRVSGHVIGNLQRTFLGLTGLVFPVGTANGYSQVTVIATAGTFPATFTVKATEGAMPGISGANKLARYWTLTNTTITSADLTFNYLAGDVTGTVANYQFIKNSGGTLSTLAPTGTPTSTSATINGVSSFSDWTLAEAGAVLPGSLQLTSATYSDSETNADHVFNVPVTRTGGSDGNVSVTYTVTDGTATTADNDYVISPSTGTLTWLAGDATVKNIAITIKGDTTFEPNETVNIAVTSPTGGATLGSPNTAVLTITNDDAAPSETNVAVTSGNLVITDGNGGTSADTLTISLNGANVRINDPSNTLSAGAGATQVDANTVDVPFASITGNIQVNTLGGNDTLTLNFASGNLLPPGGLSYDGGTQTSTPGDRLAIVGGSQGTVTYNYTSGTPGAGNVQMSAYGPGFVTYTGLEPITNSGIATDIIFNLPAGPNAATLADDGTGGNTMSRLSAATIETTDFANPTGSLTINRGNVADTMAVNALPDFNASLTIGSAGNEFSTLSFNGAITLLAGKSLAANTSSTISLPTAGNLATSGSGSIVMTTASNIVFASGSSLTTVDGPITLNANQQGSPTSGTFIGADVNGGSIQATGAGVVTLNAKGGTVGAGNGGVLVHGGGLVKGGTTSAVMTTDVLGTGGSGGSNPHGVEVDPSSVITSFGGDVRVRGFAGVSTSINNYGVIPVNGGLITSGGNGNVTVQGTGGTNAGGGNAGVIPHQSGTITSGGTGTVTVTGTGGNGPNSFGVQIFRDGRITSGGTGNVVVTGTAGPGSNIGVFVDAVDNNANGARINSGGGSITVTGTGTGGNFGIVLGGGGTNHITSVSNAPITLIADAMTLDGTGINDVNSGTGTTTLRQLTNTTAINLGGADGAGVLGLTDAELDKVTAGTLQIGNINSGAITVSADISRPAGNFFNLISGANIDIAGGALNSNGGDVTLAPGTYVFPSHTGVDVTTAPAKTVGISTGKDLKIVINSTTVDSGYTQLNVAGLVNIIGVNLVLSGTHTPVAGQTFTIVNNDDLDLITGTFAGLPEGAIIPNFLGSPLSAQITYVGGPGGNDAILAVLTPDVSVAVSPASVLEDGATNLDYTFTRTNTAGSLTINFLVGGTATFGTDYTQTGAATFGGASGTVTFAGGSATAVVSINPTPDATFEANETVILTVTTGAGYNVGSPVSATGTITNDDVCASFATVYVDDSWVGTPLGDDPDGVGPATSFGCDSFATIQEGVNAVTAGGNVIVRAGTYPESVLINKALTLNGAQVGADANTRFAAFTGGPANPKADPTIESIITAVATAPTNGANDTVHVMASNVTIDGFVVDGNNAALAQGGAVAVGGINTDARTGIQTSDAAGNGFAANNVLIQHNIVQNFAGDNTNNLGGGITLVNPTQLSPATSGSLVTANVVRNFGAYGILLSSNAYGDVTSNTVDTPAYPAANAGIWVYNFPDPGGGPNTINITSNTVTVGQDNFGGIWINLVYAPAATINISSNTVNAAAGVLPVDDFTYGIYLSTVQGGSTATLTNNIVGASGGTFDRGIALWNLPTTVTTTVTGGTVGKSVKGVSLHENDPNFLLSNVNSAVNLSGVSITGPGSGTTVGIFVDATDASGGTVAMQVSGNTSVSGCTTGISVVSANASANIHDNAASIHDNTTGIDVSGGFTITSNNLFANATGLRFSTGATGTAHFNRLISTTTAIDNANNLALNLENNWWGCNAGPGNTGCGAVTGTGADFNPWIVLGVSAVPNSIAPGGGSTVTADMTKNSDGATPVGTLPDMAIAWTATNGTMSPTSGTVTAGTAVSTFTSTNSSSGTACGMVDNQNTCAPITVVQPSFSIDDVTHLEGNGGPGTTLYTFTISKTGAGAASVDYNTVDGTATSPSDFTAIPTTPVSFLSADTTKQFTVLVNGDTTVEPNEAFTVHLSNASGATISDADGTGTITNDDVCGAFATVYVDDDWAAVTPGTDPDGVGPATNFGCDSFATIQGGVNGVTTGGTVIVRAGTYPESVLINKALTLNGAQVGADANTRFAAFVSGPDGPKANPTVESIITAATVGPASNLNNSIHVDANNVTVDGFVVDGNNPALAQGSAVVVGGINTDVRRGIETEDGAGTFFAANNAQVKNNVVQNFAQRGIEFVNGLDSGSAPATTGGLISGNVIRNFKTTGIELAFNSYTDVTSNTVIGNDLADACLMIQDYTNTSATPRTINVSNNTFTVGQDSVGAWANLMHAPGVATTAVNFSTNTINAGAAVTGTSDFTYGIYLTSLEAGTTATVTGNIVGASGGQFARGIALWNLPTNTPTAVTGGTIGHSLKGVSLHDNDPGFGLAGSNSAASMSGVSIDGTGVTVAFGVVVDATLSTGDTVAMEISGNTSIINTNTAIDVIGTNASANIHNNAASIHNNTIGIEVVGGSATITSNNLFANATGLQFGTGATVTAHFNRIISTTTAISNANNTTPNLENNWWGCNAGPGNAGCGAVTGTGADFDPWIVLGVSASPNPIAPGGGSTVTADMTKNSDGATPVGTLPDMAVAWSATNGTMSPTSGTVTAGTASSTFTSTNSSPGTACAMVDNQQTCTPIGITLPSFSIDDVTHLEGNGGPGTTSYTFTITKTGAGAASVDYNTVDGTATSPSDFTAIPTTPVSFLSADTTKQFTVLVNGDTTVEPDEAFTVHLSNASNATISDADGTGTITNDDVCGAFATVYVDDDWAAVTPGTDPDGVGPATNFGCDSFATIQGGVNGVTSGGNVIVRAGTYAEAILINKPLTLQGAQVGANANTRFAAFTGGPANPKANPAIESIITAAATAPASAANDTLHVMASNVTIDGFVVDGNNAALNQTGATPIGGINTDSRRAIQTEDAAGNPFAASNTIVRYNVIQNFAARGVELINGTASNTAPATTGNVVTQNRIRNFGVDGIVLAFNASADITFNTVDTNDYPTEAGIWVQDFLNTGTPYPINIANNNVTVGQDNFGGIWANLAYLPSFNINNNTVNAAAGVVSGSDFTYGIYITSLRPGSSASLSGNIVGSSGGTFDRGIALWNLGTGQTTTVTGGTVGNSVKGVSLHDNDPNFGLAGSNSAVDLSGVSITNATTGIFVDAIGSTGDTVAMQISGNTSVSGGSTGISVQGANASANIHNNAASIHDNGVGISVAAGSATIISNNLFTNGTGLRFTSGASATAHFNRIISTTTAIDNANNLTLNLENNWWGCNAGPGNTGCGAVTGTGADFDPWIVLGVSAVPNSVAPGGGSTVTADMTKNSDGATPVGTLPDMAIAWTATNGTMSPTSGTVSAGTASSTFTSTSSSSGTACAMVDNQQICTPIGVSAPSFSIDDVTHLEGDPPGTTSYVFTVTKTGSTGLSSSVNFTTQDGSATLADNDYQTNSGPLNFGPTDTTMQITVLVNRDTNFEPNEAFNVHLSGAVNATISDADGTGTITNDDTPGISGHVAYDDSVTTFGKNVTMTLTGNNGFVTRTTTTDANGDYSFVNVPSGNDYTLTPSKVGDVGALHIESADASKAARFVAGLDVPTATQVIAADADGDGILTSFDAALIARYAAGLPNFGIVGTWKFVPVNRSYSSLAANQSAQNFTAILVGDTDGNWQPALPAGGGDGNGLVGISSAQSPDLTVGVPVSLPNVSGAMGSTISVPITVGDLTGQGVKSYDLQVSFNSAIVQPAATPFDTSGTLSSGMLITPNAMNSGHLIISAFQATPDLTGSGTLINLRFTIVGTPGQVTPTTFADYTDPGTIFHAGFRFNAGTPAAITTNGSIHVNGPTAAAGAVSGRVTDETGRPVSGVVITLIGTQSRKTITDADGNYRFDEVETGGFYTVTPSRANYGFSPGQRSFSQMGNNTDAVFTAVPNGTNVNPLDTPEYFVRQQYLDFLGREPDEAGFNYWVNNIEACGADSNCLAAKRTDTSAAFFLSTEFQQTGYLVYRMYQSAYGDMPGAPVPLNLSEFRPGRQAIGQGVVVNQSGWEAKLEANKQAFALGFVQRARFTNLYPTTTSPAEFVDSLFRNAGVTPNGSDRAAAIAEFAGLADTADVAARAHAVRLVAENAMLRQQKFNQAFVLMQYFGYLGRDPNTLPDTDFSGYTFWLNKLDSFNGDFRNAEMVKAFLVAGEYRGRFPR